MDMFSIMSDTNDHILRTILEGSFINETAFPNTNRAIARANFDKMKTAYNACMDEEAIKKVGAAPLRVLLDEMERYYPAVAPPQANVTSRSSNQELTELLTWLAKRTVPSLINTAIMVSPYTDDH